MAVADLRERPAWEFLGIFSATSMRRDMALSLGGGAGLEYGGSGLTGSQGCALWSGNAQDVPLFQLRAARMVFQVGKSSESSKLLHDHDFTTTKPVYSWAISMGQVVIRFLLAGGLSRPSKALTANRLLVS